ncbi:hypothetical protein [Crateriforma conspicua]|uniref:hypothetical protein n=1 Tax=Crateriforma conspicua TaxID=2527996 RepID=UPI0013FD009B|nr:hypothetical protein [Crateriforma conspicua]
MMRQGMSHDDVLQAAANLSDFDRDNFAASVTTPQLPIIGEYVYTALQSLGVQRVLLVGGLLELFAAPSDEKKSPEIYASMLERLGIKKSRAYEFRAVWRRFGKKLINEPKHAQHFIASALVMLSRDSCPEQAVDEAIKITEQGETVDIAAAKRLIAKHTKKSPKLTPEDDLSGGKKSGSTPRVRNAARSAWQFTGRVISIALKPNSREDRQAIIRDLREAIESLERSALVDARIAKHYGRGA